ncbi:RING/FYVE/PHD zinc finger superfamily protein [Wolffia australiana]
MGSEFRDLPPVKRFKLLQEKKKTKEEGFDPFCLPPKKRIDLHRFCLPVKKRIELHFLCQPMKKRLEQELAYPSQAILPYPVTRINSCPILSPQRIPGSSPHEEVQASAGEEEEEGGSTWPVLPPPKEENLTAPILSPGEEENRTALLLPAHEEEGRATPPPQPAGPLATRRSPRRHSERPHLDPPLEEEGNGPHPISPLFRKPLPLLYPSQESQNRARQDRGRRTPTRTRRKTRTGEAEHGGKRRGRRTRTGETGHGGKRRERRTRTGETEHGGKRRGRRTRTGETGHGGKRRERRTRTGETEHGGKRRERRTRTGETEHGGKRRGRGGRRRRSLAHVACALLVPEAFFRDPVGREETDLSRGPARRWKGDCCVCGSARRGCVADCSEDRCGLSFHASCGLAAGFCVEYRQDKTGGGIVVAYCQEGRNTPAS